VPAKRRGPTPKKRLTSPAQGEAVAASSSRYTAPQPKYRIRPKWHRFAGWFGVLVGVAIAVANDGMLIAEDLRLLPFGHQELYLILALLVAGGSTWFLGVFDRGTTIYD
jgi:hypothetical protein